MQTLLVILSALIASIVSGPEPTVPIFLGAGLTKTHFVVIYGVNYFLMLNIFFWWLSIFRPWLIRADWSLRRYFLWKRFRLFTKRFTSRMNGHQEKKKKNILARCFIRVDWSLRRHFLWKEIRSLVRYVASYMKGKGVLGRSPGYYFMGIGHLYLVGLALITFKKFSWEKVVLSLSLYLGALSRLTFVVVAWSYVERFGWMLTWLVSFIVIVYLSCKIALWLYSRICNLSLTREEISIAAS